MARKQKRETKFSIKMQKKLAILFILVLLAFVGLSVRLTLINKENGEQYKKQVLSQQRYDSKAIPFKRGNIVDSKGTQIAMSEKVYNLVIDAKVMLDKDTYIEPTMQALKKCLPVNEGEIREYIAAHPDSSYYVPIKRLEYEEISDFVAMQNDTEANPNIKGVWFEEEYKRSYPYGTLASDVIGFTGKDNVGSYGLEEYYNDTLNGTNGREYGYLNGDATLERTTKAAVDGSTIVTTLDVNIQKIVEKYLKKFNDEYTDNFRDGNGAKNMGCIVMDMNTGGVLAMANYPVYDLNDTKNPDMLLGTPLIDEEGKVSRTEIVTKEAIEAMNDEMLYQNLNGLWKNYAITSTFEPGSTAKPFTVATALETGRITGEEAYFCGGFLDIGDYKIRCHNRLGDGMLTVKQAIEKSCNVALMQIGEVTGEDLFLKFQEIYNFGLKTNIDLAGEARTSEVVFNEETMRPTELATSTFGQGNNVTMIQMITAFTSLVNGGYYYEPHMVGKIVNSEGATIKNIEPRILKQTISADTSETIKEYCNGVVTDGTGKTARPAGYAIGGKTGTAEKVPRDKISYVVSFMGYAPANDPQIAIFVVVDEPNAQYQDDAKFATGIVRNVLTEVLPYLGVFRTEELSETETAEIEELEKQMVTSTNAKAEEGESEEGEETETEGETEGEEAGTEGEEPEEEEKTEEEKNAERIAQLIENYEVDQETGYLIEPGTGALIDPSTGYVVSGESTSMELNSGDSAAAPENPENENEGENGE